jgi:class 3 adenylate cyclase
MQCKNCGRENSETARFCANCGAPLQAVASDAAELRQLTVLFCDLVGSTKLAEFLEPEDLRELTGTYHSVCDAAIIRHDGHIAQYLGDGVVVYFGYPIAHEDDARRAVRAALEIVADLSAVAGRSLKDHAIALNARLGIHTGPVIVGEIGGRDRREQLAVGKTPNVAARIQNIAGPGEVVVSDATYRIVRGFFDFTPLGPHEIKGLSEAITLHRVLRESGAQSRLDAERRTGLTSLTGRDAELRILDQAWDAIPTSGSHAVLVQGEAGIGKSRIVDSLRARVERQQGTVLECFCSPYAQNAPLFPIVEQFERGLGFTRETTDAEKRTTLERRLERQGILTEETFALMAELLSISLLDAKPLVNYSPQKRRERTLETLLAWLMTVAHDGPTLWVVEDLHWMDPTSLSFVSLVLESLSTQPLLVILTFRPDFAAPWRPNVRV